MRSSDLLRLALQQRAGAGDLFFLFEHRRGHVLTAEVAGIGGGDVHRHVVDQFLENIGAGHEIGLAIHFHHHAELPARVNVGADEALLGDAAGLLAGRGNAVLAQHHFRFPDVALGFLESLLAFHHAGAGALAQVFDQCRGDFHNRLVSVSN